MRPHTGVGFVVAIPRRNGFPERGLAMGYETEKADAKRQDVKAVIAESLRESGIDDADLLADRLMQRFADVTAPYREPERMQFMTFGEGGVGGGSTTKPGNVVLNLGKLVRAIGSGILTIAGAAAAPWLLVIGALVTWDALWSCLNLKLTEDHANHWRRAVHAAAESRTRRTG